MFKFFVPLNFVINFNLFVIEQLIDIIHQIYNVKFLLDVTRSRKLGQLQGREGSDPVVLLRVVQQRGRLHADAPTRTCRNWR